MTRVFAQKVMAHGIIDTRKYRYRYDGKSIKRIALAKLDTAAALDGWEIVHTEMTIRGAQNETI